MGHFLKPLEFKKKNKKASFFDILIILGVIFGFIICTIFGLMLWNKMKAGLSDAGVLNASTVIETAVEKTETVIFMFDYLFIFLFGGLIIATIIGAFMIDSHPIFLVLALLLLFLVIFVGWIFWYQYNEMLNASEEFANASSQFTVLPKVIDKLPLIALGLGVLIIIVMVAKIRGMGGGG